MSGNQRLLAPDSPVDLTNCDLEPIHIPSLIQPHGMLLAARSHDQSRGDDQPGDSHILYTSANSQAILGIAPAAIFELTLPELLGRNAVVAIETALGNQQEASVNVLACRFPISGEKRFDVSAHLANGLLYVELEPTTEERHWDEVSSILERAMRTLRAPGTLSSLCAAIPPLIRKLTGYDRVMVYQFDPDGHGKVVAEAKNDEIEPFLGLHYPATDIPAQARRLYLLQRLRILVDINYQPVPVLCHPSLVGSSPLDMTYCGLRSISPIHVEYLQNMGVGASLALSIVHQGELWGMIVCHHRTCRKIAPELRAVCDLLSQHISLLIGMAVQGDAEVERTEKSTILSAIGEALSTIGKGPAAPGSIEAAIASQDLLTLLKADGAFIRIGEIAQLIGRTPPLAEAEAMLSTLHPSQPGGTLFTDHLSDVAPDFASLSGTASGVYLMQLVEPSEGILWFRGEVARTVDWAGKPDDAKQSFEGAYRLSPRKSFALWKEIQAGHSLPWRPSETEGALVLQRLLCKALLERTEKEILRLRHQVSIVESRQQAAALQTQIEKEEVVKVRQQETIDLATTYKQLKSIMDSTSDGVLEVSYDWMILYGNLKAMQALPDFRLGKSFWECLPAVLSTPFETSLRIAMEERREMHFEHFYGPYKAWHRVSVFPADEGISIFFRDVTAEKAMEDQLNLEQLLREKRIEALSYMAGGLAHEISNPLAIIHALAGDLQALAAGGSPLTAVEVEKTCGDIVRTADRAMRILRGLRGFAREARQDPMGLASIAEILDECMHLQEARFERHQVEIEIMIQPDCPLLLCREVQIGQILTNLLNNAFDAVVQSNATERWVSLAILWHDDAMTIDITDSGPGVEDHFRAHLMEPFFTTKELGLGMGVGLSLSRTIAQDHGGTLTLCDNTEHTCFRLTLPAPTGVALQAAAANMMEEAL